MVTRLGRRLTTDSHGAAASVAMPGWRWRRGARGCARNAALAALGGETDGDCLLALHRAGSLPVTAQRAGSRGIGLGRSPRDGQRTRAFGAPAPRQDAKLFGRRWRADGARSRSGAIRLSRVRFDPAPWPRRCRGDRRRVWRVGWRGWLRPFLPLPPLRAHGGRAARGSPRTDRPGRHRVRQRRQRLLPSAPWSDVRRFAIPDEFLVPSIRNSRPARWSTTPTSSVGCEGRTRLPSAYPPRRAGAGRRPRDLDTAEGLKARASYKCRNRTPWYTVPDVRRPAFVQYMSGRSPALAVNRGRCTCTNAFLAVDFRSDLFGNGGMSEPLSAGGARPAGSVASSRGTRSAAAC